jgi:PBP1b-binding outer membrane lipoprotein LpoB
MKKKALISNAFVIILLLSGCMTNPPLPKPASSDVRASSAQTTSAPDRNYNYKNTTSH